MIKLTEQQIKEIAEYLDAGMVCHYNLKTGKIIYVPNFNNMLYAEEEDWREELDELDENWLDYFTFDPMTSRESFLVMADFIDTVDDRNLQERLVNALNRRKPFRNFKWEIDNSGEYRQKWFEYKEKRYIEAVKKQIERYNRGEKMNNSDDI